MMRVRLCPEYVALFWQSWKGRTLLIRGAKWAVNQASINQGDVRTAVVPLPPLSEQQAIVAKVAELMGAIERVQEHVRVAAGRLNCAPRAVLSKAFHGELLAGAAS